MAALGDFHSSEFYRHRAYSLDHGSSGFLSGLWPPARSEFPSMRKAPDWMKAESIKRR